MPDALTSLRYSGHNQTFRVLGQSCEIVFAPWESSEAHLFSLPTALFVFFHLVYDSSKRGMLPIHPNFSLDESPFISSVMYTLGALPRRR